MELTGRPRDLRLFKRTLPFFQQGALLRLDGARTTLYYVAAGEGPIEEQEIILLDGASDTLRLANEHARLALDSVACVEAYLRYFCDHLRSDTGAQFILVDDLEPGWVVADRGLITIEPLRIIGSDCGNGFVG